MDAWELTDREKATLIATRPPEHLRRLPVPVSTQARRALLAIGSLGLLIGYAVIFPYAPLVIGALGVGGALYWVRRHQAALAEEGEIEASWRRNIQRYCALWLSTSARDLDDIFSRAPVPDHAGGAVGNFAWRYIENTPSGPRSMSVLVDANGDVSINITEPFTIAKPPAFEMPTPPTLHPSAAPSAIVTDFAPRRHGRRARPAAKPVAA